MQLTLRNLALGLALIAGAGSCGDEFVSTEKQVDERLLGVFSGPHPTTPNPTDVGQFHIRPDGTVVRFSQDSCKEGAIRHEEEYVWHADGPDTIVITDPTSHHIQGAKELRVTPGFKCDQIRVAHLRENGTELYDYQMFRGEFCLYKTDDCSGHGCSGCVIGLCDGAHEPEPCE